jgi:hypothetical protein
MTATIERAQQVLDDICFRLGDLTSLIAELAPPEATASFANTCDRLYGDLVGHANLTVRQPAPDDPPLRSIVPPGRRFHVWHRTPEGVEHLWYFPDADDGVFTDGAFNRIEPPDRVRAYAAQNVP